jgi:hypothetical protein
MLKVPPILSLPIAYVLDGRRSAVDDGELGRGIAPVPAALLGRRRRTPVLPPEAGVNSGRVLGEVAASPMSGSASRVGATASCSAAPNAKRCAGPPALFPPVRLTAAAGAPLPALGTAGVATIWSIIHASTPLLVTVSAYLRSVCARAGRLRSAHGCRVR